MTIRQRIERDLGWIEVRLRCGERVEDVAEQYATAPQYVGKIRREVGLRSLEHRRHRAKPGDRLNWNGGWRLDSKGYVLIKVREHPDARSDGYIFEHRLVMEKVLGRRLGSEEAVHHENGVRDDNRPENLRLFGSQDEHREHHASSV
jgi:hypothetical protein